jgi:NAD+ synthase
LKKQDFSKDMLRLDVVHEADRIVDFLAETVGQKLHRRGAVVGISGGIDSSVVLALCVRAFGAGRVTGILLPEKESSPESAELAHILASQFGVETFTEDITAVLDGFGCYSRRNAAIQRVFPEYRAESGWKVRIVLPGDLLEQGSLNVFYLVVTDPQGKESRQRLPLREFAEIVAASNFKQRARTNLLYYHAELRNYAVIGTPNKNEHDLGFFVKFGDGGYDLAPIRHLFKAQVYQLAEYLDIPQVIRSRPPTTDTYPGGGTQEEFFFRIPFEVLDLVWLGYETQVEASQIALVLGLTEEQVVRVEEDIERKRRTTAYLRTPPLGLEL